MQQQNPLAQGAEDIGAVFRQAREKLNLSLEAVAKETSLRPSILQAIENNQFEQKDTPAMFIRGYVRSYAKFLRLPDELWQGINFGTAPKNDLGRNARNTSSVNHYSSHNSWIGWVTVLVILAVGTMTGLWWWENHQKDNADRDQLVQTFNENSQKEVVELPAVSTPVVTTNVEIAAEKPAEANNAPQVESAPAVVQTVELAPVEQKTETATAQNNEQNSAQSTEGVNVLQNQMDQITQGQAIETPVVTETSAVAGQGDLVIEVTGNCWISVKNAKRKTLAEKQYKAGEVLTFSDVEEPYSLIIGAPGNVKISYKGESYPLKVDGRVARFKLPQQ